MPPGRALAKGSNSRARTSGGIPGPSSATSTRAKPPCTPPRSSPRRAPAWAALASRLASTWRSRPGSARTVAGPSETQTSSSGWRARLPRAASAASVPQVDQLGLERPVGRQVEEVLGQRAQPPDLAQHVLQPLLVAGAELRAGPLPDQLHRAPDDAERIADLVRHRRRHPRDRRAAGGVLRDLPLAAGGPPEPDRHPEERQGPGAGEPHPERQGSPEPGAGGGEGLARLQGQRRPVAVRRPQREVGGLDGEVAQVPGPADRNLPTQRRPHAGHVHPERVDRDVLGAGGVGDHLERGRDHVGAVQAVGRHDGPEPVRGGGGAAKQERGGLPGAAQPLLLHPLERVPGGAVQGEGGGQRAGQADQGHGEGGEGVARHGTP